MDADRAANSDQPLPTMNLLACCLFITAHRYCSRDCQSSHWLVHKPVCQQLAAAAGGNGALQGSQAAS
jgi:hypothetical protein